MHESKIKKTEKFVWMKNNPSKIMAAPDKLNGADFNHKLVD
jgi:hypothetical protein